MIMLSAKEARNVSVSEMRVSCGDILPFHLCHQDYHYSQEAPRGGKSIFTIMPTVHLHLKSLI